MSRIIPRQAHSPGETYLTYTPNGKYLLTAGANGLIRKFTVGSEDEPITIEQAQDAPNNGITASNDRIITCSQDGTVTSFSMSTNEMEQMLSRCPLPVRDVAISPDGTWCAVASDETFVKIVNTKDMLRVMHIRQLSKPAKHVSFHPNGNYLAISCTDGIVYVYSLTTEEPELVKRVDGVIAALESDSEFSSRAVWHPDGRAFAAVTREKDVVVVSRSDWTRQRSFAGGHNGDITSLAWSSNGAILATAGTDGKLIIWESKTQTVLARYDHRNITSIAFHPSDNVISFTTNQGQLYTLPKPVPEEHEQLYLRKQIQPAPLLHDDMQNLSIDRRSGAEAGRSGKGQDGGRDSADELFGDDDGEDDWLVDDDGAGYAEINQNGKRGAAAAPVKFGSGFRATKRYAYEQWKPDIHEAFQPGSTPWRGNRRYLYLSLIGFVWTVDQETHNTVTVEFYDREAHRDFHFTDHFLYDKACLNEHGTLFSSPPGNGNPAMLFYRPHETWTSRTDWRTTLPPGEEVVSIALSDSYIVACTSADYVRIYTLCGIPYRIYKQKQTPVVTCACWRNYVMIMGNGPAAADGRCQLTYTIDNVKRDETLQSNDVFPLPDDVSLRTVFFSDTGDPMIYTTDGVLFVLLHWRQLGQAKWVPILDTKLLERRAIENREESYWPVAVSQQKFCCIILKGEEKYPYFPRPLLSEFDFKIPLKNSTEPIAPNTMPDFEERLLRESVLHSLADDLVASTQATREEQLALGKREMAIDRLLVQMLAIECKDEDRGDRALEIVGLMRQNRTLDMAMQVAAKYDRTLLAEKISKMKDRMEIDR